MELSDNGLCLKDQVNHLEHSPKSISKKRQREK